MILANLPAVVSPVVQSIIDECMGKGGEGW